MRGGRGQAIALICSPEGLVLEVLLDELGIPSRLAPGMPFANLFEPDYAQTANDFLLRVADSNSLAEEEFKILQPHGYTSLFFSAYATARGIIVFGGTKALTRAAVVRRLRALLRRSRGLTVGAESKAGRLASAAHDLRNPIAGILAASQYLLDEPLSAHNEEHVRLLESIQASSRFLLRLVDDVLNTSTLERGKANSSRQSTDLLALLQQNLAISQLLATSKGVRLSVIAEEAVPPVALDPTRVSELIDNLIGNAIKSSPETGTIVIRLGRRDGMALISVRDQGPGIPAGELHNVFEPFRKGSGQRRLGPRGAGLGIVKRIVDSHGGQVEIDSEVGRGSAFTVLLPISSAQAPLKRSAGQSFPF
jgi:signal transduction histidine kinase